MTNNDFTKAKLNSIENAETIEVKLTKERFPIAYQNKFDELVNMSGMTEEEAKKYLDDYTIVMELVYHKNYGLFMVESEAVDCTTIYSPYNGTECDDSEVVKEWSDEFLNSNTTID